MKFETLTPQEYVLSLSTPGVTKRDFSHNAKFAESLRGGTPHEELPPSSTAPEPIPVQPSGAQPEQPDLAQAATTDPAQAATTDPAQAATTDPAQAATTDPAQGEPQDANSRVSAYQSDIPFFGQVQSIPDDQFFSGVDASWALAAENIDPVEFALGQNTAPATVSPRAGTKGLVEMAAEKLGLSKDATHRLVAPFVHMASWLVRDLEVTMNAPREGLFWALNRARGVEDKSFSLMDFTPDYGVFDGSREALFDQVSKFRRNVFPDLQEGSWGAVLTDMGLSLTGDITSIQAARAPFKVMEMWKVARQAAYETERQLRRASFLQGLGDPGDVRSGAPSGITPGAPSELPWRGYHDPGSAGRGAMSPGMATEPPAIPADAATLRRPTRYNLRPITGATAVPTDVTVASPGGARMYTPRTGTGGYDPYAPGSLLKENSAVLFGNGADHETVNALATAAYINNYLRLAQGADIILPDSVLKRMGVEWPDAPVEPMASPGMKDAPKTTPEVETVISPAADPVAANNARSNVDVDPITGDATPPKSPVFIDTPVSDVPLAKALEVPAPDMLHQAIHRPRGAQVALDGFFAEVERVAPGTFDGLESGAFLRRTGSSIEIIPPEEASRRGMTANLDAMDLLEGLTGKQVSSQAREFAALLDGERDGVVLEVAKAIEESGIRSRPKDWEGIRAAVRDRLTLNTPLGKLDIPKGSEAVVREALSKAADARISQYIMFEDELKNLMDAVSLGKTTPMPAILDRIQSLAKLRRGALAITRKFGANTPEGQAAARILSDMPKSLKPEDSSWTENLAAPSSTQEMVPDLGALIVKALAPEHPEVQPQHVVTKIAQMNQRRGVSPEVARDIGQAWAAASDWSSGRSVPPTDILASWITDVGTGSMSQERLLSRVAELYRETLQPAAELRMSLDELARAAKEAGC